MKAREKRTREGTYCNGLETVVPGVIEPRRDPEDERGAAVEVHQVTERANELRLRRRRLVHRERGVDKVVRAGHGEREAVRERDLYRGAELLLAFFHLLLEQKVDCEQISDLDLRNGVCVLERDPEVM